MLEYHVVLRYEKSNVLIQISWYAEPFGLCWSILCFLYVFEHWLGHSIIIFNWFEFFFWGHVLSFGKTSMFWLFDQFSFVFALTWMGYLDVSTSFQYHIKVLHLVDMWVKTLHDERILTSRYLLFGIAPGASWGWVCSWKGWTRWWFEWGIQKGLWEIQF